MRRESGSVMRRSRIADGGAFGRGWMSFSGYQLVGLRVVMLADFNWICFAIAAVILASDPCLGCLQAVPCQERCEKAAREGRYMRPTIHRNPPARTIGSRYPFGRFFRRRNKRIPRETEMAPAGSGTATIWKPLTYVPGIHGPDIRTVSTESTLTS